MITVESTGRPTGPALTYRRLDGDPRFDYLTLDPSEARQAGDDAVVRRFRRCRVVGSPAPSPAGLLHVLLPVPPGAEDEWNTWYDTVHLPGVVAIADGVRAGHRFRPADPDQPYLVIYEFATLEALEAWQRGTTVRAKKDEYFQQWGVRNNRRAFALVS
ncbi:hypothetical protein [Actinophytocola sp.]|uniref:hypothetical protein n=1 Tax=Actinophytocola sp. TaxID=1872138 RepID=UPI003D6C4B16